MQTKEIYIKIYNTSGTLKRLISEFTFSDFTQSINGGSGYLSVGLGDKFDDFGLGTTIDKDYQIKVVVNDNEGENVVYNGRIDDINTSVGDTESVVLGCSGYIAELAQNLLDSGTTVYFSYNDTIENIIKDILDKHNTSQVNAKVDYTATSIQSTSKTITARFFASTVLDALLSVISKADAGWFFYVDNDNVFNFKQVSSTPDHYFVMGKDLSELEIMDSNRSKITRYLFFNGRISVEPDSIFKLYSNGDTDRRFQIVRDDRITVTTTANEEASRYLDTFGSGIAEVRARIIDSNLGGGYDIESVRVGDTCKFLNVETTSPLPDNGIITSVLYNQNYIDIVVEDVTSYVSRMLLEQKQRQSLSDMNEEVPTAYTT